MKKLLTLNELAETLGVKPATVYKWTHLGTIPYIKVGRLVRFREEDIERWLKSRTKKTVAMPTADLDRFLPPGIRRRSKAAT
ncbi:MAG: helix-turn-helix domain-containing protein [candidate division Zixibacteria bacterium]|nr:helix-turn-helix domain-containing protein [candidate division Zixibacteria bacterium]